MSGFLSFIFMYWVLQLCMQGLILNLPVALKTRHTLLHMYFIQSDSLLTLQLLRGFLFCNDLESQYLKAFYSIYIYIYNQYQTFSKSVILLRAADVNTAMATLTVRILYVNECIGVMPNI